MRTRPWLSAVRAFFLGVAAIVASVAVIASQNILAGIQLARCVPWGLLAVALLLEWRAKRRWYLVTISAGAMLHVAAQVLALMLSMGAATDPANEGYYSTAVQWWAYLGAPVGLVGYACVLVGACWWIAAQIGERKPGHS